MLKNMRRSELERWCQQQGAAASDLLQTRELQLPTK